MKIKDSLVDWVGSLLVDDQLWYDAKLFVEDVQKTDLTGEQKKEKVKNDLMLVFKDVGTSFIHFAIELAVLWLKSKQK